MSLPEVLLWRVIRSRQVNGLRFRRQQPFGPYVLDFYCPEFRHCLEVDGAGHSNIAWSNSFDNVRHAVHAFFGIGTVTAAGGASDASTR